ncbi:MAG TPA: P-loop NTPase [Terriglobales bacterium]|nr:P-loop NTPase [Terriglobales bacterium]
MSFISVPPGSPSPALAPLYELEAPPPASPRRHQLQNALYRQRWLGLGLVAACVLLAGSASWWLRPYYQADGSLIIQHPRLHAAELTPQEYPPPVDPDREMQTELSILGSRAVAAPVIAQLDLMRRDPEIERALAEAEQRARARGRSLGAEERRELAEAVFAGKLRLAPDQLSSTVQVRYGSHDPAVAAAVVNATIQAFLRQTLAERGAQGELAAHWMEQQVEQAQARLAQEDGGVAAFQQQHAYIPLLDAGGAQSGLLNRLGDANHAWSAAQAERIADQAAVASYGGEVVAALPAELRNPEIDRASANVGAAEEQLSALQTTYRPNFPLVVEARQQLAGAQRALAGLERQVAAGLRQRLASSQQREQALGQLVDQLSRQAAAASGLEMQFGVLKSRADAQRALVATLRQKLDETKLEASLPPSNLTVLDAALPPRSPLYPQLPLDLGLGLGLGLVVGLGTVLTRERWTEALTAGEAVKRGLGSALAPLGMVPERRRTAAGRRGLLPAAGGLRAEPSYHKIAANLVARGGAPPRAILVTSVNPGEGKTTSLCQLALALAESGWRTLVVDADLGRPGCHSFFGLANASGLQAAQAGRKVAPLAVAPHLDLMPAEEPAGVLLQARAMAGLMEQWRQHYDYILLDSPPGNHSGEAVLLSSLVEGVVVVLRWGRTRLPEAQQLCEELARARAPLLGTLFNRADPSAPEFRAYQRPQ